MLGLSLMAALLLKAAPAPHFDSNRAWEHLRQLVSIGPRPSGSVGSEQTRKYIKDQLSAVGLTTSEQSWVSDTPGGPIRMVNVTSTIPGAKRDRIIVAGHYDTKRFTDF